MNLDTWEAKRIMFGYVWNPDKGGPDSTDRWVALSVVIETQETAEAPIEFRLAMMDLINVRIEC